jgi:hypothetical protein
MAMDFPDRGPIDGVFRYVLVTDTLVPEPSMAALAALASAAMTLSHRRAALRGFT